ncbi:HAD family hydrolase [Arthrobacter zhaoguopingii]|uniref:HAD family hydrolase n=1 Tax=Arthrobacter zhaoguopingii TaxID=2681491 RepID=UPI0013580912|nr:HAD family phosphatase [Arthrobacter zhaoguopingii]
MPGFLPPPQWYLFDYGMVISTEPTSEDWDRLEEEAGVPGLRERSSAYWQHRDGYDAGDLSPVLYWSRVTGHAVSDARASWLDVLDANQWSHYNLETLDVLDELSGSGARLALLSNMPAPMVGHFAGAPWTRHFEKLFFSSSLRLIKPDGAIFSHVLAELGTEPGRVLFIDDSAANIAAARGLGIDARLHLRETDLSRELRRLPV